MVSTNIFLITLPYCFEDHHNILPGAGCLSDADCPTALPICSVLTGSCVECEITEDCTDAAKPVCDFDANICIPS
jgi:hypothetical protein